MRILAGEYGGRSIIAPAGIRPMSEKVRGALFDIFGDIDGKTVLDAYAGSGVVGFEALSRGAAVVEAVEHNRQATEIIKQNRASLAIEWGHNLTQSTVESWLARLSAGAGGPQQRFDLIVADPPYEKIQPDVLEKLGQLLTDPGVMVVSQSSRREHFELKSLRLTDSRIYGDTALHFYRK